MSVLIYDGDCGFCTWAASWVRARVDPSRLQVLSWQQTDLAALGLSVEQARRALQWVGPQGRFEGSDAVSACLIDLGGGWGLPGRLMRLPGIRHLLRPGYRFVARHRHRLPYGTASCELRPRP